MSAKDAQIPSHQSQPAAQRAPPSDWMCTVAGTPPRLFAATKCPRELRRNSHQQIAPNEGLMSHYIASGERASQPSIARTGMVVGTAEKNREQKRRRRNHFSKSLSSTPRVRYHKTADVPPSHKGTKHSSSRGSRRLLPHSCVEMCRTKRQSYPTTNPRQPPLLLHHLDSRALRKWLLKFWLS